jgi:hypothetical protein
MNATSLTKSCGRWAAAGIGLAGASYAAYAGLTWSGYGLVHAPTADEADPLLDRFMPNYEIAERHHIHVGAPAGTTFAAASEMDLQESRIIRAIFKGREWIMGSQPATKAGPRAFVAQMRTIGWGVLAEIPDREIVMGAVTQPWKADVVFRPLPPEEFAAFCEPDYVKIVWTLEAEAVTPGVTRFRTETRVKTTDEAARRKFGWYWLAFGLGIRLIRWSLLRELRRQSVRRHRDLVRRHVHAEAPARA